MLQTHITALCAGEGEFTTYTGAICDDQGHILVTKKEATGTNERPVVEVEGRAGLKGNMISQCSLLLLCWTVAEVKDGRLAAEDRVDAEALTVFTDDRAQRIMS